MADDFRCAFAELAKMALDFQSAFAELEHRKSMISTDQGIRCIFHGTLDLTPEGRWIIHPPAKLAHPAWWDDGIRGLYHLGVSPYGLFNPSSHLLCSHLGRCFQFSGGCMAPRLKGTAFGKPRILRQSFLTIREKRWIITLSRPKPEGRFRSLFKTLPPEVS